MDKTISLKPLQHVSSDHAAPRASRMPQGWWEPLVRYVVPVEHMPPAELQRVLIVA